MLSITTCRPPVVHPSSLVGGILISYCLVIFDYTCMTSLSAGFSNHIGRLYHYVLYCKTWAAECQKLLQTIKAKVKVINEVNKDGLMWWRMNNKQVILRMFSSQQHFHKFAHFSQRFKSTSSFSFLLFSFFFFQILYQILKVWLLTLKLCSCWLVLLPNDFLVILMRQLTSVFFSSIAQSEYIFISMKMMDNNRSWQNI